WRAVGLDRLDPDGRRPQGVCPLQRADDRDRRRHRRRLRLLGHRRLERGLLEAGVCAARRRDVATTRARLISMNRTGLLIALAVAAVVGVVFGLYPELDLRLARPFFEVDRHGNSFGLRIDPVLMVVREASMWVVAVLAAPAVVALVIKIALPRRRMLVAGRATVFLLATLAIAPGLMANFALKEHWGRSRPIDVKEFRGAERFVPWWDPRGDCPTNCSFVSG